MLEENQREYHAHKSREQKKYELGRGVRNFALRGVSPRCAADTAAPLALILDPGHIACAPTLLLFTAGRVQIQNLGRHTPSKTAHEGDDHAILGRRDRRMALTLFIYLLALVPALFFNDVGLVLSFAGAIAGSCLSYIGPGSAYIAVHGEDIRTIIKGWFGDNKFSSYMLKYPTDGPADFDAGSIESELTHLNGRTDDVHGEDDDASASQSTVSLPILQYLCSSFGFLAWYLFLFPCWSALSDYGSKRIAQFKEEEALKSPRINRLEPPKANRNGVPGKARLLPPRAQQAATDDDLHRFRRIDSGDSERRFSGDQEHVFPSSYGATGYGNQAIAKAISRKKSAGVSGAVADEVDDKSLQETIVRDFIISVLMILGGTVAMCLGVYTTLAP